MVKTITTTSLAISFIVVGSCLAHLLTLRFNLAVDKQMGRSVN